MKILLASESYLKNYIFKATNLRYSTEPADIDETMFDDQPVEERVISLARKKCETIADRHKEDFVISADTLITVDGEVFSKPSSTEEAFRRSLDFSGKTVGVFTGAAIYSPLSGYITYIAKGAVEYMEFTKTDLRRLLESDNPQLRNGLGVFVDSPGFTLIARWEGSYTGIMGLPMEFIYPQLRSANLLDD